MSRRFLLLPIGLFVAVASASEPATYTPEIHGVLTSGRQPAASNVCLRQSDSEIRNCGYADTSGRFFISSGPVRRSPLIDEKAAKRPLKFWLETGNVQSPQKLWPIEASVDRNAAIDLSCDMAAPGRSDPTFRSCDAKPARPLVVREQRDDTPYRMQRPASSAK